MVGRMVAVDRKAALLSVCFNPVTQAIAANHPTVTWCDYVRFTAKRKITKGAADVCESSCRRYQSPPAWPGAQ
ncbi:hypothetical protein MPLA_200017 [Mesorhizobium sp. ORS 3359]|nr:hypothetical protein MPLA_200017 [Mesorhizobium sp. ORS 3359]